MGRLPKQGKGVWRVFMYYPSIQTSFKYSMTTRAFWIHCNGEESFILKKQPIFTDWEEECKRSRGIVIEGTNLFDPIR